MDKLLKDTIKSMGSLTALKNDPAVDKRYLTGQIKGAEGGANRYPAWASTEDKDRDGDVIRAEAFSDTLKTYLGTNPVVLLGHDMWGVPVGKAVDGKIVKDKGLTIDIEFAETDLGREVRYLIDNGFLNTLSVGFIPKDWIQQDDGGRDYLNVDLLEVSVVTVPSNAAAQIIRQAKQKGVALSNFESLYRDKLSNASESKPEPKGVVGAENPSRDKAISLADCLIKES